MKCRRCKVPAQVALPSHNTAFCPECFFTYFERQVERAIKDHAMFTREDRVVVALSGGKDSLSLMDVLARLGYDVTGLHIYLGIGESSESARAIVERFCESRGYRLVVKDVPAEGLAIPDVKRVLRRPICSACGKIKRYFFNKITCDEGFKALATGHNLDDETARLFANTLRWDAAYLSDQGPALPAEGGFQAKVKPLYRLSEYETACYAFLRGIEYGYAPCPYSTGASFTGHKKLLEDLEHTSPGSKIMFYDGFLRNARKAFEAIEQATGASVIPCTQCGYPTSGGVCGVCRLRALVAESKAETETEA